MKILRTYRKSGCKWEVHIIEREVEPNTLVFFKTSRLRVMIETPSGGEFVDVTTHNIILTVMPAYLKKLVIRALKDLALIQALEGET